MRAVTLVMLASCAALGHRLEPADGTAFHIGGQSNSAFTNYSAFLGPQAPAGYMWYTGVSNLNETLPGQVPEAFMSLLADLQARQPSRFLVPQIGLSFTSNGSGYGDLVASGAYDNAIAALGAGLAALGRPVFLRVGYEFNGRSWNGYKPSTYVSALQRIVSRVRAAQPALNRSLAVVWDYACDDAGNPWAPFWPGDGYVDWWGVNIFSGSSAPGSHCARAFVDAAEAAGYPVLLGESTPRYIGAGASWGKWFGPYFDGLVARRAVKAFSYIDWNWAATRRWPTWGDCRVEAFPDGNGASFRDVLANASRGIFSGAGRDDVLRFLGAA